MYIKTELCYWLQSMIVLNHSLLLMTSRNLVWELRTLYICTDFPSGCNTVQLSALHPTRVNDHHHTVLFHIHTTGNSKTPFHANCMPLKSPPPWPQNHILNIYWQIKEFREIYCWEPINSITSCFLCRLLKRNIYIF